MSWSLGGDFMCHLISINPYLVERNGIVGSPEIGVSYKAVSNKTRELFVFLFPRTVTTVNGFGSSREGLGEDLPYIPAVGVSGFFLKEI